MSRQQYIPVAKARAVARPGGDLIVVDDGELVTEYRCDVGAACDQAGAPRLDHQVEMIITGPGHPASRVTFGACNACLAACVPNPVRVMLDAFGLDVPGLRPD